jgi:hypothetical protein
MLVMLGGCGSYFPPSPTSRAVSIGDLAGKWEYSPTGGGGKVTLVLNADGTFEQNVKTDEGKLLAASGKWEAYGADIDFEGILDNFSDDWTSDSHQWRIIDRDESPTGFSILGGAADPDQWVVFRWVSK